MDVAMSDNLKPIDWNSWIGLLNALLSAEYLNGLEGDNQSIYEGRGLLFI